MLWAFTTMFLSQHVAITLGMDETKLCQGLTIQGKALYSDLGKKPLSQKQKKGKQVLRLSTKLGEKEFRICASPKCGLSFAFLLKCMIQ